MRIDDSSPKVIMAASCGIEVDKVIPYQPLLNDAIEIAEHTPEHVVMLQRPQAVSNIAAWARRRLAYLAATSPTGGLCPGCGN